jgi:hypothetical protein
LRLEDPGHSDDVQYTKTLDIPAGEKLWVVFYPRGYDPSKYGFGVRHNDSHWRVDDRERSPELAWMSSKYAKRVPPLPVSSEGRLDMRKVDVYIFGAAKVAAFIHARKGMIVHRWRAGTVRALRFGGKSWRVIGEPDRFPLGSNVEHSKKDPVFPPFKLNKRQLRRMDKLRNQAPEPKTRIFF